MKILCVGGTDGSNIPFAHVLDALVRKGHEIRLYVKTCDHNQTRMFSGIQFHLLSALTDQAIEWCDFIFSAGVILQGKFIDLHKYVFTYTQSVYMDRHAYGDFTFTQRKMGEPIAVPQWESDKINIARIAPSMAVGNPKFDMFTHAVSVEESKEILFIDSGHFPFGYKAKDELANALLSLAVAYPEYRFTIKPRFLPSDKHVVHRNEDWLYEHIEKMSGGNIPSNLYMLQEHVDLEELVARSRTVITTLTTAYFDALLSGKGLIILDGFSHEYNNVFSRKYVSRFHMIMEQSGCMVNYHKAADFLPDGLSSNDGYINKWVYSSEGASEMIVEAMEYIWIHILSRGGFPHIKYNWEYQKYKKSLCMDEKLNWEDIIHRRYKNLLYNKAFIETRIDCEINLEPVISYIESLEKNGVCLNKDNYNVHADAVDKLIYHILLVNEEELNKSEIDQSWLFHYKYKMGEFHLMPENRVLCKELYYYLAAKTVSDNEQIESYLGKYFALVNEHLYDKTIADSESVKISAYYHLGRAQFNQGKYEIALSNFENCQKMTGNMHKAAWEYIQKIKSIRDEDVC